MIDLKGFGPYFVGLSILFYGCVSSIGSKPNHESSARIIERGLDSVERGLNRIATVMEQKSDFDKRNEFHCYLKRGEDVSIPTQRSNCVKYAPIYRGKIIYHYSQ